MAEREFTCPKCSKTVSFVNVSTFQRRRCPHCGQEIMDWDGKPDQQQHSGPGTVVPPKIVLLVVVALVIGAAVFFYLRR